MDVIMTYVLKPLLIFVAGYIYIRLAGKKAVSEMNSFDMLFIIMLGTVFSEPILSKNPWSTLIYGGVLMSIYFLFSRAVLNNKLRWLFISSPTVLIRNGDIDESGLRKAKITTNELIGTLRKKGYVNTADVELAVMEDMGQVSVIPKAHARPLQPSDIHLHPSPTFIPIPLIMNGEILFHNLKFLEKDEEWLNGQLQAYELNIDNISDVTLATYDQNGMLSIDTDTRNNRNINNPYMYKPGNDN